MSRRKLKAKGQRGSWFATVDGEVLPCCHKHWMSGRLYRDPGLFRALPQSQAFVDAISAHGKIILTDDEVLSTEPMVVFQRKGYIGVFSVKDIVWRDDVLTFEFVQRLEDLE